MRREQLTEKIIDIKHAKGWSWKHITTEIGGVSPILIVGALLGQMETHERRADVDADRVQATTDPMT